MVLQLCVQVLKAVAFRNAEIYEECHKLKACRKKLSGSNSDKRLSNRYRWCFNGPVGNAAWG